MIKEFINHDLKELNSFHVEQKCLKLITFERAEELDQIFSEEHKPERWYVLGGGNNILFTQDYDGVLIHPIGQGVEIIAEDEQSVTINVQAGVEWDDMVAWCVEHDLWGAENLSLIPGSVGASPVQNIGAYGAEAKDIISRVHLFSTTEYQHKTLTKEECRFAYRESIFKQELKGKVIITSVDFTLSKQAKPNLHYGDVCQRVEELGGATLKNIREAICSIRNEKLPDTSKLGNAGSFFKNPIVAKERAEELKQQHDNMPIYPTADPMKAKLAAGWLIDKAGMKGYRTEKVGVHSRQALVLVNHGGACGRDVIELSEQVQQRVWECFGIRIEPEVNIL
jgi:UDP-N-acetylmuramate dehydrogenase